MIHLNKLLTRGAGVAGPLWRRPHFLTGYYYFNQQWNSPVNKHFIRLAGNSRRAAAAVPLLLRIQICEMLISFHGPGLAGRFLSLRGTPTEIRDSI